MRTSISLAITAFVIVFIIFGYACVNSPSAVQRGDEPQSIILISELVPDSWPMDTVAILNAEMEEQDVLKLTVEYCAGSRAHVFRLLALPGWLESYPPGKYIVLSHDARGDDCIYNKTSELYFDLKPLRELEPKLPWIWLNLRGFRPAIRYILNE